MKLVNVRRVWASPSLIGWYALRIAEDLAEGSDARLCKGCGAPFLSQAYQAAYCGERCKARVNMRAYRKKLKTEQDKAGGKGKRGPVRGSKRKVRRPPTSRARR